MGVMLEAFVAIMYMKVEEVAWGRFASNRYRVDVLFHPAGPARRASILCRKALLRASFLLGFVKTVLTLAGGVPGGVTLRRGLYIAQF